jgi:hypothetical protein
MKFVFNGKATSITKEDTEEHRGTQGNTEIGCPPCVTLCPLW